MVSDYWGREGARYRNVFRQSAGQLIGIATGLISDGVLTDGEVLFLQEWLTNHVAIATVWPGNIVCPRINAVLSDGVITGVERQHLISTLQSLIGGDPETVVRATVVTALAYDAVTDVTFPGSSFCFTGDFVYAERSFCEAAAAARGGVVKSGVSRTLTYLVVGSCGSMEWKHGSFGTKIEKAMSLKRKGHPITIVPEETWVSALERAPD